MPYLSVVLPTYNRQSRLRRVLAALERQTYPLDAFEVIVVSDGSTDETNDYLSNIHTPLQLKAILQPNAGPAAARNNGVRHANGEIILFLDDDVIPTDALVAEHANVHTSQLGVVVLGPMLSPPDFQMFPWVKWEQAMLGKQYDAMNKGHFAPTARQFYTGNTSLPVALFRQAGGFDERFRRAEDIELAYRLADHGACFQFHPQAVGNHYAERSFRSWLETPYAYGRNDVIFAREKHQDWILPTMRREFQKRHPLIQWVIRGCLGRFAVTTALIQAFQQVGVISHNLGLWRVSQAVYSAIFNLRYYQGVADQLGGRAPFMCEVAHGSLRAS